MTTASLVPVNAVRCPTPEPVPDDELVSGSTKWCLTPVLRAGSQAPLREPDTLLSRLVHREDRSTRATGRRPGRATGHGCRRSGSRASHARVVAHATAGWRSAC